MASNRDRRTLATNGINFHGGRVLIPASERREIPQLAPPLQKPRRAALACNNCRTRKTKCTGEQPYCAQCVTNKLECTYGHGRKDKLKGLTEQKQTLVALLQDVSRRANDDDRSKIARVLNTLSEEPRELSTPISQTVASQQFPGPEHVVILNPSSQNTELMGRRPETAASYLEPTYASGEMQWLPTQQHELLPRLSYTDTRSDPSDASYYINKDDDVDVDLSVDAYDTPSREIASKLFQAYLNTIHDWLPILPDAFGDQFDRYYSGNLQVARRWLALLNIVFAISAQHARVADNGMEAVLDSLDDHLVYVSRALKLLGSEGPTSLTSAPDISSVRGLGLLSLYHLAVGHVSSAWISIGLALRYSVLLGLHVTSNNKVTLLSQEKTFARTWWSVRALESLLSSITGRPCAIPEEHSNVLLPEMGPEGSEESRKTLLLNIHLKMGIITQRALSSLYSVRNALATDEQRQRQATTFESELKKLLPPIMGFSSEQRQLLLRFNYFDTMIVITRPFLWTFRRRSDTQEQPSDTHRRMAEGCLQAAESVVRLLPDEPDEGLHRNGPWWCLVHRIMRAMAIFLITISPEEPAAVQNDPNVVSSIKKLVRWLRWMQPKDAVARRALQVVLNVLRQANSRDDFADVLEQEMRDVYGEYLLVPGTWDVGGGDGYPQMLPDLGGLQSDTLGGVGVGMDDLLYEGDQLPRPPTYGAPFESGNNNLWDW